MKKEVFMAIKRNFYGLDLEIRKKIMEILRSIQLQARIEESSLA